jgi:hypothetical protein
MVPSCGARSAGRPTSRDELPGELWQVRRWGVTSQELAAVHYEKWGPRQPRKWLCGGRQRCLLQVRVLLLSPSRYTNRRAMLVRQAVQGMGCDGLPKQAGRDLAWQGRRGYPLRKPHCGYDNDNVALIRLVRT